MEDHVKREGIAFDFPPHHLTRFTASSLELAPFAASSLKLDRS